MFSIGWQTKPPSMIRTPTMVSCVRLAYDCTLSIEWRGVGSETASQLRLVGFRAGSFSDFGAILNTSALPRLTDIAQHEHHFRKVPLTGMAVGRIG
jgi:hypothetical protein